MLVSKVKPLRTQLTLFDVDEFLSTKTGNGELNHGRVRTVVGDFFEQLTCQLVSGQAHRTDCRCDYCPDVSANGKYYEVKSAGRSGQTFIYADRLKKDLEFSKSHDLSYLIWRHNLDTAKADTVAQLKQLLRESILGFALVPFPRIYELCKDRPPQKLNSRYGSSDSNPLYGSGYRIQLSTLTNYYTAKT